MMATAPKADFTQGFIFRGQVLHHPRQPLEEARELIAGLTPDNPDLILIFGLGLGYYLQALSERWPEAHLAAYEPEPGLRQAFWQRMENDPGRSFLLERLTIMKTWGELNELLTIRIVHGQVAEPLVLIHPGYKKILPDQTGYFKNIIRGARLRRAVMEKTLREKGHLFFEHLAANLNHILELPLITDLQGRLPGRPGFIVGSGPGLEKNVHLLKNLKQRGLILAAGSAWQPLRQAEVTPDLVVVLEAEDTSSYLTGGGRDPEVLLALASAAHPNHFQVEGFSRSVFHLSPGAAFLFGTDIFVPQAGTSGSAAFTLGLLLGLNPLILVGQDQAFPAGQAHAAGTPGETPLTGDMISYSVQGYNGEQVRTHSGFAAALHWFAESARYLDHTEPERIILNATESGAHIPGIPDLPLSRALESIPDRAQGPGLVPMLSNPARPDAATVKQHLRQAWKLLSQTTLVLRLSGFEAVSLLEDLVRSHPLLRCALAGLDLKDERPAIKHRLERAEGQILNMIKELD